MRFRVHGDSSGLVRLGYELRAASRLAMESIRTHKLRSFLTLLGVIIGVASVVLVGAAIEGLGIYAEESTAKVFGSNTFLIAQVAGPMSRTEFFERIRRNKPIRPEDVRYLETTTGDRVLYSPFQQRSADISRGQTTYEDALVQGVGWVMPELRDINLIDGRFFTEQEDRTKQPVAVIGYEIAGRLFPSTTPLGKTIKLGGLDFTVVGIQERLGSAFGRTLDNTVYIPFTVFTRMYGRQASIAVFARARPETGMGLEDALDTSRVALRTRHHTRPQQTDRFDVTTPDAIRSFIDTMLSMISAIVIPVTCISLVVGGIVIMNIMLVSVTERTHEIGIRKSLGARQADIRLQFLIEAVMLAAVGGAVGVLAGAGVTQLLAAISGLSLRISVAYVFLAVIVSSGVGIASGWYPAARAARLDPIVALRSE